MALTKAEVRLNHCNYHLETCCCDSWAVYVGNEKHSTHFNKGTAELVAQALNQSAQQTKFKRGDRVFKPKGSSWHGIVVGEYSTRLTPEGYAVESSLEQGSVQIYPAAALELDPSESPT